MATIEKNNAKILIEKKNIEMLVVTLKGVIPANFESMERLVASVQYLESVLAEKKDSENVEETNGG